MSAAEGSAPQVRFTGYAAWFDAVDRGGDARVLRLPQHGNARLLELPKNSLCMLATAVIDDDDPGNLRVERGAVCDECQLGAKRREHRDDSRTVRPATGRR